MTIHKEGTKILISLFIILATINFAVWWFTNTWYGLVPTLPLFLFVLNFFRYPSRGIELNDNKIYSPADGKVVVIEETEETEYFKDKRIQVSIFMSAWNVHANWFPANGIIKYYKYHPGLFLLAINPKSSTDNERNTTVVETQGGLQFLMRQIAGVVARRIVFYPKEGDTAKQGDQFGFIKFGSRVDLFFPLETDIKVKIGDKTVGKKTVIAEI